jgi:predicted dienelactone hydrolase
MKTAVLLAAAVLSLAAFRANAADVGFAELRVANGEQKPLVVGVWYPTSAPAQVHPLGPYVQIVAPDAPVAGERLPLIVMSHGNGSGYTNHFDTALALAKAGFVAVTVSHTGDTYDDQSRALFIKDRLQHIRRLIDYMLTEWPDHARIDADRIGMFGFSSGGFTALILLGGVPDVSRQEAHHQAHPDYYDAQLVSRASEETKAKMAAFARSNPAASTWLHEPRIKAAVVAAPAVGYTFGREGLKDVTVPIQLWRAAEDHILPNPDYAEAVHLALPGTHEYHVVENADHFDFLAPCTDLLRQVAPVICVSRPGFDRTAFHQAFNAEVVRFFSEKLK